MRSKITSAFQFLSRDCNRAVLSALSYSLSTTFLNVGNKVVFSLKEFDYPLGSIAFQNVISLFVLLIFIVVGLKERPQFHPGLARSLLLPNVCFSMFLYSNAKALRYINLPVLTVIKSFAPLVVSILEVVIFKDPLTTDTALCMVIVVASNYVTASNDVEFSLPGYVWAAVNVVSNVAYLLSLRKSLSDHYDMLTSAFHFTLISLIFIFPLSFIAGDFPHIIKSFLDTSQRFRGIFFSSGFLAAGITIATFWCLKETNGSTLSFLGAMSKIPTVLLAAYLFDSLITPLSWVGIFMSIFAGILFARAKAVAAQRKEADAAHDTV